MTTLLLSDIYAYVKARIDEISNNEDASLVTGDQAVEDLEKVIKAVTVAAVRKIHLEAPNILLKESVAFTSQSSDTEESTEGEQTRSSSSSDESDTPSTTPTAIGTQYYKHTLNAPSDFLRLVTLQMSDWSRPIQTLVGEDSAEYRKQGNIYLMGTPLRPVGALLHHGATPVIELYSCLSASATVLYARYIPEPAITTTGGVESIDIVGTLKYPCLDQITAETLRSIGRHQEAQVYDSLAVQPFRIDPDYARKNPVASERVNTVNG